MADAGAATIATLPARPIVFLAMAGFVSAATLRSMDPLVPAIAGEFATTPGAVGLTVTAFALAYGLCQLFWGPVGDRYGKYRVVTLACFLSAATAGAAAVAHSLAMLAALRLASGVTAAAIIPLAMAFIGDHVAYEQRQATLARFISGQVLGLIGGQVIGGIVGDLLGWRAVFLVLGALFLLAGLLLWRELRAGALPPPILGSPGRPAELALAYLRLVRRPWPRTVLLTVFAEGCLFFGALAYVGVALHGTFGLSYSMVGVVLGAFGCGGVVYVLNARVLLRRLGERGLARGGGCLVALGFLALPIAPSAWLAALAIGLLGLGFYMLHNTLQTNATQMAPEARGLAVSTFASFLFLGQGLGAWLGGLVVDGAGTAPLFATVAPLLLLLALAFAHRLARRPAPMTTPHPQTWLEVRPEGLYCRPGDFFVDPLRPVATAVVSHGHSDHARAGHDRVLATPETLAIMAARLGEGMARRPEPLAYGETIALGDTTVWLAPAGHVLGSAQVVIEHGGCRAVYSGDYKRQPDPTCTPFTPVACDLFITEATFGLPVFRHPEPMAEIARLLHSVATFPERCHVIGAYALGKAQRLIALLRQAGWDRPIFLHGALLALCDLYRGFGIDLGELRPATAGTRGEARQELAGQIVLAPPGAIADRWARRLPDPVVCMASGWMRVKQRAKARGVELPLVISDHADWDELLATMRETGAPEVWITHGREEALAHAAAALGIRARALALVGYEEEGS